MKKTIFTLLLMFSIQCIWAQESEVAEEEKPSLVFSGSVDTYFRANLGTDYNNAPPTSFANLPGFALGMINGVVAHEGEKFGFTADLVFGPRGEDATFLSGTLRPVMEGLSNSSSIINQLYVYWAPTESLKFTLGNFNTFLGYEVISPTGNFNYSTSYMFSYGPFSHTGLKADLSLGKGFSAMAGIFNPTDATEYNPGVVDSLGVVSADYAGGLQLGYENGGLGVWLNGLFADGYTQLDLTAGYDVTEKVYVGVNATTAVDNFYGVAAYFQVATSETLKLGIRAENFTDMGIGVLDGVDESVFNVTLSANYTVGNLTFIPEVRLDAFSSDIVPDGSEFTNSLSSFVLAAVYDFN